MKLSVLIALTAVAFPAIAPLCAEPLCAEPPQAVPVVAVPQAAVAVPVVVPANETARFLAGLPPGSDPVLCDLAESRSWRRHAEQMNKAWAGLEKGRLSKVRQWSATHIPTEAASKGTMFYMFSGPDFLYADAIYPGAATYIFCGTEPVGPIPDLTKVRHSRIPRELESLRSSLDSILSFSFFITKKMKKDLYNHELRGTLPVISIFLARAGKTIQHIEYVGLDKEGVLTPISEPERRGKITVPGVKVTFHGADPGDLRTLYYFRTDISNGGLQSTGYLKFCQGLAPGNSLVKSASYLMHNSYFSQIRAFLLENTETLVQDDSGIPVSFFPPEHWELRLFGAYPGPIPLFKERTQQKLFQLYRDANPIPLDFGIGYRHRKGESMLIVAKHRTEIPTKDAPKAVPVTEPVAVTVPAPETEKTAAPEPAPVAQ